MASAFYPWQSSGYGVLPGGRYGPTTGTEPDYGIDYGVLDPATGKVVSIRSGKPWSGVEPRTGVRYNLGTEIGGGGDGVEVPYSGGQKINPNNPSERYKSVDITKSPQTATETDALLKTFKDAADASLKSFNELKDQFAGATTAAVASSKAASDIGPNSAALQAAQGRYAGQLTDTSQQYQDLLAQNAAAERGIVQQGQDLLPSYDEALNRAENLAVGNVNNYAGRYAVANRGGGAGAPGMNSSVANILAAQTYRASLPYEQAKINKRYDLLTGLDLPVQQDITGRETSRLASFNPAIAGSIYGSSQSTQQAVQALKVAAANQDWQTVAQIANAMGLPPQVQQRILSGDASVLAQLDQLWQGSRYLGLQDVLGVTPSQPEYPITGVGGEYPPTYRGRPLNVPSPAAPGLTAPNSPQIVGPGRGGGASAWNYDPTSQGYHNSDTGEFVPYYGINNTGDASGIYGPGVTGNPLYDIQTDTG